MLFCKEVVTLGLPAPAHNAHHLQRSMVPFRSQHRIVRAMLVTRCETSQVRRVHIRPGCEIHAEARSTISMERTSFGYDL